MQNGDISKATMPYITLAKTLCFRSLATKKLKKPIDAKLMNITKRRVSNFTMKLVIKSFRLQLEKQEFQFDDATFELHCRDRQ